MLEGKPEPCEVQRRGLVRYKVFGVRLTHRAERQVNETRGRVKKYICFRKKTKAGNQAAFIGSKVGGFD